MQDPHCAAECVQAGTFDREKVRVAYDKIKARRFGDAMRCAEDQASLRASSSDWSPRSARRRVVQEVPHRI